MLATLYPLNVLQPQSSCGHLTHQHPAQALNYAKQVFGDVVDEGLQGFCEQCPARSISEEVTILEDKLRTTETKVWPLLPPPPLDDLAREGLAADVVLALPHSG